MSALVNTSSSETKSRPSRSWRGGSQQMVRNPQCSAYSLTSEPTFPTPTMPSVRSSGAKPSRRASSANAADTHCNTPLALQPAEVDTAILCATVVEVDVVEAYGCGGYELHLRTFQECLVAAGASADDESVSLGNHLLCEGVSIEILHLGVWLQYALQKWYGSVD